MKSTKTSNYEPVFTTSDLDNDDSSRSISSRLTPFEQDTTVDVSTFKVAKRANEEPMSGSAPKQATLNNNLISAAAAINMTIWEFPESTNSQIVSVPSTSKNEGDVDSTSSKSASELDKPMQNM